MPKMNISEVKEYPQHRKSAGGCGQRGCIFRSRRSRFETFTLENTKIISRDGQLHPQHPRHPLSEFRACDFGARMAEQAVFRRGATGRRPGGTASQFVLACDCGRCVALWM